MFVNDVPDTWITCLPVGVPFPSTSSVIESITPTSNVYASALNPVARSEKVPKLDAEFVTDA